VAGWPGYALDSYDGTRSMFENAGFDYERPKGKNHSVMRKTVPSSEQSEDGKASAAARLLPSVPMDKMGE
jgi:hypothetical protein